MIFGSELGDCQQRLFDILENISVTVHLTGQGSWRGEWMRIYFQNMYWSGGSPWDYVECDLSGIELSINKSEHSATCSSPVHYYPGDRIIILKKFD